MKDKPMTKSIPVEIEELRSISGLSYIECVIEVCEKYEIELESMKSVLPKAIKLKIESEASELKMLKPEHRTKTIFDV